MRRALAILVLVAAAGAAILATGAGDDNGGSYRVRAVFDNAAFVIPGEEVRVAGAKVGRVTDLDVTKDFKAAITLDITDKGFQDFRTDAQCRIRPQSLIGDRFVECDLTRPRSPGQQEAAKLPVIPDGRPGAGDRLLKVAQTQTPVDIDLINNVLRLPERQRLSLIVNSLGTGLAGRGTELNEVIRRANPALKETGAVLRLLARQNQQLKGLARDSDTIMAPLARDRRRVASFITRTGNVAQATAERRADLRADLERLPTVLRELKPTMQRLGALSDEMTPVVRDLGDVAPDVNRLILQLGPFSRSGTPAITSLGEAARRGIPAVRDARPIVRDLRRLAVELRPVGQTLRQVLDSFQRNDGVERLMDYIFYQVAAINGYDSIGHYLRAGLIVNTCSNYSTSEISGCEAKFSTGGASARASVARSRAAGDPISDATAKVLAGADPKDVLDAGARERNRGKRDTARKLTAALRRQRPVAPARRSAPSRAPSVQEQRQSLFDYLFGEDGR